MLTKEQWAQVEADLSHPYCPVGLRCDDHEITLKVEREKGLKFVVSVYVDGWIKGEWFKGEPEHVRKFWREHRSFLWKPKQRAEAAKRLKQRGLSKDSREWYGKVVEAKTDPMWFPHWPNAKALCRHLRKTCTTIERLQPET
ncbi:MAG: hypothetical protein ROZ37_01465 [Aromatoleum sp.]|jgi:hypothetical protein|uniref:hypothetical protein n=1 Tax=Aromatoleum sp. TaxID=2307007 RepID=UPI0028952239|nr:hypothetical protein [Aromatoleum sp.]MDT3668982.1 hypothetical protein [Aromatoleum sp.]